MAKVLKEKQEVDEQLDFVVTTMKRSSRMSPCGEKKFEMKTLIVTAVHVHHRPLRQNRTRYPQDGRTAASEYLTCPTTQWPVPNEKDKEKMLKMIRTVSFRDLGFSQCLKPLSDTNLRAKD